MVERVIFHVAVSLDRKKIHSRLEALSIGARRDEIIEDPTEAAWINNEHTGCWCKASAGLYCKTLTSLSALLMHRSASVDEIGAWSYKQDCEL